MGRGEGPAGREGEGGPCREGGWVNAGTRGLDTIKVSYKHVWRCHNETDYSSRSANTNYGQLRRAAPSLRSPLGCGAETHCLREQLKCRQEPRARHTKWCCLSIAIKENDCSLVKIILTISIKC